jgi:long-chain acyl-CoA synthetase
VVAVVVGDADAQPALTEHCRVALAGYKQPRRYEFVDKLPRNAYGKVLKRELRDRLS